MTASEILRTQNDIYHSLNRKELKNAFGLLSVLTSLLQEWSISDKLQELETSYKYMIRYRIDGIDDPAREKVLTGIIASVYSLTDKVTDLLLERESPFLYYSKKRYYRQHPELSIQQQADTVDTAINNLSLNSLLSDIENNENTQLQLRRETEHAGAELFLRIWTNYPATEWDYSALRECLSPGHFPNDTASLIISALLLNVLQRYDEQKLLILLDTYDLSGDEEIRQRALCAALILLYAYRQRIMLTPGIPNRIEALKENDRFCRDTHNIFLQLIKSRETERISRKFTEEILPEMMKISPAIYKRMKQDESMNDINALDKNPEWQEILEQSGITDKLKELNDLQLEGADVFMSTFSNLKSFSFFQEISNWFRLFIPENTALSSIFTQGNKDSNFKKLIMLSHFLCNSDKYSFCLSLTQVPQMQREMMVSQFNSEGAEMQNIENERITMNKNEAGKNISNQYLQDLYRFFKLSPIHTQFTDPFAGHIDLFQVPVLRSVFDDDKTLRLIGEFYFKKEYYDDALCLFEILTERDQMNSELYQKAGYCHQMVCEYEKALNAYLKAEMLNPQSFWTIRRIATCYRALKAPEKALEYYLRAEKMKPDNLSVEMNIGHCYMEQKDYESALKHYFKVDYLDPQSSKSWRPIAWCSFLSGKREQAQRYYEKILAGKPNSNDFMNAGHVEFALNNLHKAITLYRESIAADKGNAERFLQNFSQDTEELIQAGIRKEDIPLLLDQLMYSLSE